MILLTDNNCPFYIHFQHQNNSVGRISSYSRCHSCCIRYYWQGYSLECNLNYYFSSKAFLCWCKSCTVGWLMDHECDHWGVLMGLMNGVCWGYNSCVMIKFSLVLMSLLEYVGWIRNYLEFLMVFYLVIVLMDNNFIINNHFQHQNNSSGV